MRLYPRLTALVAVLALGAGCKVITTEIPAPVGPSEYGLSVSVTAAPDSITRDGGSQSSVIVMVRDSSGSAVADVSIRVDMVALGVLQDFGTLSARNISTGTDGRGRVVYTAPPPGPPESSSVSFVTIVATPVGSNFQAASSQTAEIRLNPQGVILPPAGTPTAAFTFSPGTGSANVPVYFDASSSLPGAGASSIVSYDWMFGDGHSESGPTADHSYEVAGTYNVTLTVINDRGLAASTTLAVTVVFTQLPTPAFVYSPKSALVEQAISFNGAPSTAAPGREIDSYNWNFGDGRTASGITATHTFAQPGTYAVTLTVADDLDQNATVTQSVEVGVSGGPKADFVFSPTEPTTADKVFFNASASAAAPGGTIVDYDWDFGDGGEPGVGREPTHKFAEGTWNVVLTVTDDEDRTAVLTKAVSVGP